MLLNNKDGLLRRRRSNIVLNIPFNGANGSTTFTDLTGKTVTAFGDTQISTAQSVSGGSSGLFDGNGDYLEVPNSPDWAVGTGNFSIEGYVNFSSVSGERGLVSRFQTIGLNDNNGFAARLSNGNSPAGFRFIVSGRNNGTIIQRSWSPSVGVWYKWRVERVSGIIKILIDDVQLGADELSTDNVEQLSTPLQIGVTQTVVGSDFFGYMDDILITKG